MHLVLIKPDGIGDYLLFRNFLPDIRHRAGQRGRITAVLNPLLRGFADVVDAQWFDRIIWFNQLKARASKFYTHWSSRPFRMLSCDEVVYPLEGRMSEVDWLASKVRAPVKVAAQNDHSNMSPGWAEVTDTWYSSVVSMAACPSMFQFDRNRYFFSRWLDVDLRNRSLSLDRSDLPETRHTGSYAVIFPGAGAPERRWNTKGFARVARHLIGEHNLDVVIAGGAGDESSAQVIMSECGDERVSSTCGKMSLAETAALAARAKCIVTNDTFSLHLAAALNVPAVCVSNGNDVGRFHPYPEHYGARVRCVYPSSIRHLVGDPNFLNEQYGKASREDIHTITADEVVSLCDETLDT